MIRSRSWLISAWNPKLSVAIAILEILSGDARLKRRECETNFAVEDGTLGEVKDEEAGRVVRALYILKN